MMRLDLRLAFLLIAAAGIFCAAGFYICILETPLHVPFDPNEGWNAYFQAAAITGGDLYPGPHNFMINNYPPISFYLVGAIGTMIGDNIVAGRFVSLICFAILLFLIIVIARRLGARVLAAGFGAFYFAAALLVFSDYVGMNDPQLMGQALQLVALYGILRAPRARMWLALCGGVFALSLFVKHNLIALPLASFVWLMLRERRSALVMAGAGVATGVVGLALFHALLGGNLLSHFASPRAYTLADIITGLDDALLWLAVPAVGSLIGFALAPRDTAAVFSAIYAAIGLSLGMIMVGGAGVDVNAFFDAAIAVSLAASLLLERLIRIDLPVSTLAIALYFAPVVFGLWLKADPVWLTTRFWLHPMQDDAVSAQDDIAFLKEHQGAAVCETLPLCYWAGKAATVDVFNLGQAYKVGARRDGDLIAQIQQRKFSVLEFESVSPFQLGSGVLRSVRRSYTLARSSDNGIFFIPSR
jgi:dolichyl-phosphate-mannose-protein mannosyltransferase